MSMTTAQPEVSLYLEAVRSRLSDLPEDERRDLLEDLEQHLMEVAAEGEGSLVERLGPADTYAEELRSWVGLPGERRRRLGERLVERARRSGAGRLLRSIGASSMYPRATAFVGELRPGWWVLRGYVAVVGAWWLVHSWEFRLFPPMFGSEAITMLVAVGGIWASVLLGREASRRTRVRVLSVLVSATVVGVGIGLLSHVQGLTAAALSQEDEVMTYAPTFLQHQDGAPIANICTYGPNGERLKDVLLFDQDGRPIIGAAPYIGSEFRGDYRDVERTLPKGLDGHRILNAYPHDLLVRSPETGELEALPCPSVLVPPHEPPESRRSPDDPAVEPEAIPPE